MPKRGWSRLSPDPDTSQNLAPLANGLARPCSAFKTTAQHRIISPKAPQHTKLPVRPRACLLLGVRGDLLADDDPLYHGAGHTSDNPSPSDTTGAKKHAIQAFARSSAAREEPSRGQRTALMVSHVENMAKGSTLSTRSNLDNTRGGDVQRPATTGAGKPRWNSPLMTASSLAKRVLEPTAAPSGRFTPGSVTAPAPIRTLELFVRPSKAQNNRPEKR